MDTPPRQERTIYNGRRIELRVVRLPLENGGFAERELVVHPGAVVILPLMDDGRIVMIRNRRFAVNDELWELPAGTLEPPEAAVACAARELTEETGYKAAGFTPLCWFYSSPGFCNERLEVFLAQGLEFVGQRLDAGEEISVELVSLSDVKSMMLNRQITDGKTLAALGIYLLGRGQ